MKDQNVFRQLSDIFTKKFIERPYAKNNGLKAVIFFFATITCFIIGYFFYTCTLAINLLIVGMIFILSTICYKNKKLLITAGLIYFIHLIIFPVIYLHLAAKVPDSFSFNKEVFDMEKTALHKKLIEEELSLSKDAKLIKRLVDEYSKELAVDFRSISNEDSVVLGDIIMIPQLINLEKANIGGAGSFPQVEKIFFKIKENDSFHEYSLNVHRSLFESNQLINMLKEQKVVITAKQEVLETSLKKLVEENDIWSYDNLLNYSIKIFLFDSPMTPHIGRVNQIFVLHLVLLTVLSSMFFHELNKG